jgi:hypothetical protein
MVLSPSIAVQQQQTNNRDTINTIGTDYEKIAAITSQVIS